MASRASVTSLCNSCVTVVWLCDMTENERLTCLNAVVCWAFLRYDNSVLVLSRGEPEARHINHLFVAARHELTCSSRIDSVKLRALYLDVSCDCISRVCLRGVDGTR